MWSVSVWEALSFWAMVTAFVAGVIAATFTLVSRHAATKASEITQRESKERIAIVQQESNERIATVERESNAKIALAQREAAEANAKAAEANEKAEQERLARLRIEEKLAPRALSQIPLWIEKLKPFAGSTIILRMLLDNNPDVDSLAEQLASVFRAAGWTVRAQQVTQGERVRGVLVIPFSSDERTTNAANLIVSELNSDGIVAAKDIPPAPVGDNPNVINMSIGPKPQK